MKFKNWVSYFIYGVSVNLLIFDFMCMAECLPYFKFYIVSILIICFNNYILKKFAREDLKKEFILF